MLTSMLDIGLMYNEADFDLSPVENVKETKEESQEGKRSAGRKPKAEG